MSVLQPRSGEGVNGITHSGADNDTPDLTQQLDAFCSDIEPSEIIRQICDLESHHLDRVYSEYGWFVSRFKAGYDLVVRLVEHVNYGADRVRWPSHRPVQIIIATQNLKPMFSAFDRLVRGYYEDSLVLARVPYEAFMRIAFITLYPETPVYTFSDRKKGVRQFNLTNFIKDDLYIGWNHYSILSSMAHSYTLPVLDKLVEFSKYGQREPLTLSFDYHPVIFEIGVNILLFLLFAYIRMTTALLLLPHKNDGLDTDLLDKAFRYINLWHEYFMSHPTKHWQVVATDLDHVFEMLLAAEDGKDWKEIRKSLRGA